MGPQALALSQSCPGKIARVDHILSLRACQVDDVQERLDGATALYVESFDLDLEHMMAAAGASVESVCFEDALFL